MKKKTSKSKKDFEIPVQDTGVKTLYTPSMEHDSCGIGFIANLNNTKTHQTVSDAITMLKNMEHRGGCGCEPETGDGAGILIQVPDTFLREECAGLGFELPSFGSYGVGMIFFPLDEKVREACREVLDRHIEELGFELLGYRPVPTTNDPIGATALATEQQVEQVFVKLKESSYSPDHLERRLFVLRKYTVHHIGKYISGNNGEFYFTSFSHRTIVYKGLLRTDQVDLYYPDLADERVVSAIALVHSRFSTNTFPKWKLAQPFRYVAHNGEINTIRGNVNNTKSKEALFESAYFSKEDFDKLLPVCDTAHSDSANLDAMVEMLVLSGRPLPHAMMMLVPEAWEDNPYMDEEKKAFYKYHASLVEPWDGPAGLCFTDGDLVGAMLDRNGLRPIRYCKTRDGRIIMASEAGALPVDQAEVEFKGRLKPGRMFVADLREGRIIEDDELKRKYASEYPYGDWIKECRTKLRLLPEPTRVPYPFDASTLHTRQIAFGYTREELRLILAPMAEKATEPIGSMGADTPLAVLSDKAQHVSFYFKQLFAQVSNPAIDPIRERIIMSLFTRVGRSLNILESSPEHCRQIHITQPILTNQDLEKLKTVPDPHYKHHTLSAIFRPDGQPGRLEESIDRICKEAETAVRSGVNILIISDRAMDEDYAPLPSLLITGAVHHHLINKKLRANTGLVVETGDARETHQFATLIGYGAGAINPYLAFDSITALQAQEMLAPGLSEAEAHSNYIKAINYGLLKVMSKMGISTLHSYQGAQIFECVGLNPRVIGRCFDGTVSRIDGLSFDDLAREVLMNFHKAYPQQQADEAARRVLDTGGVYQWKKEGEVHLFNPKTIHLLQKATRSNDYAVYKAFAKAINEQSEKAITIRSLFKFRDRNPVPIEEVEPVEEILKRFATGAMSFGSISHEAHSTLAIAMNRIGAKSNSGEGGEDEVRFERKENGDWERSAIKQVASGRFGVTAYYLDNAVELQIKVAQGAKPGEGGQLPGHKVDDWIGRVRHSTPGVGLISPPPHHDIYSIEDLAQLIFDLKHANPKARVSVKLVAEAGVGTIAAGVAKAKADVVLISGYDGGTGASPLGSIRHAGLPWELGLAETHQTLLKNNLRSRITVQADGQIRTARDMAVATLLGAEEWGVATAALVVEGCIMMRKCHLNTCPVGIATQKKELRAKFHADPQWVVNYFTFLATEMREIMAELGFRRIDDMVGQADVLKTRENIDHWKIKNLDLNPIFQRDILPDYYGLYKQIEQENLTEHVLDKQLIRKAKPALEKAEAVTATFPIVSTDRAVGTLLSNAIVHTYKAQGLPEGTIHYRFRGSAGQSFGAFGAKGLRFELEGEANDYFGKGLSGGELIVYPDHESSFAPEENIIIGNVAFYGATAGQSFINGTAGERFAVRNSGAEAVVEGIGDHGCEYMTGGRVIVLGSTGRNFASGMSGGIAYIYDIEGTLSDRCNHDLVDLESPGEQDITYLHQMVSRHRHLTGSPLAARILEQWTNQVDHFVKVMPRDYKAALEKMASATEKVLS